MTQVEYLEFQKTFLQKIGLQDFCSQARSFCETSKEDFDRDFVGCLVDKLMNTEEVAQVRQILSQLKFKLKETDFRSKVLEFLYYKMDSFPKQLLETEEIGYFGIMYPGYTLNFFEKNSGIQAGNIVAVKTNPGEEIKYFVKTHRNGLVRSEVKTPQSTIASADIRELFIYKFFELLSVGPEVHFFGPDTKNFYIATRDVNMDNTSAYTYENLKKSFCTFFSEDKEKTNESVVSSLVISDILCRMCGLSDVTTNSGNVCYAVSSGERAISSFKIVDFSLDCTPRYDTIWEGFIQGNSIYHYEDYSDETVAYFLCERDLNLRIQTANAAWNPIKGNFLSALERARNFIEAEILPKYNFDTKAFTATSIIKNYAEQIAGCFRKFFEELDKVVKL